MKDQTLYQAIIDRYSVRQYEQEPLSSQQKDLVSELMQNAQPIAPENKIEYLQFHEINTMDLLVAQGPYGAFVASQDALVPYTVSERFPLVELGYQVQQTVVRLFQAGIGSCYLGTAGREQSVIRHFDLPINAKVSASLMIGVPKEDGLRSIANYFRQPGHKTKRLALEALYAEDVFGQSTEVPDSLMEVMTAAQRAPSAVNAQPWRFVKAGDWLYLYVMPKVYPFVLSQRHKMTYALHDAGIVMANIWLAYQASGELREWVMYDLDDAGFPACPKEALPVAKIAIN